jgi:hypothetical protein
VAFRVWISLSSASMRAASRAPATSARRRCAVSSSCVISRSPLVQMSIALAT